jgi:hypothetical protein
MNDLPDPNALRRFADAIDDADAAASFSVLVNPRNDNSLTVSWRSQRNDPRGAAFAQQLIAAIYANWDFLVAQTATASAATLLQAQADAGVSVAVTPAPVIVPAPPTPAPVTTGT